MREKFNNLFFGKSTSLELETDKTPVELFELLNSQVKTGGIELDSNFFPLSEQLAYNFQPQNFEKPATLKVRFINDMNHILMTTFDKVYPDFKGTLIHSNNRTTVKGTIGFSIFFYLFSIYSELAILTLFILTFLISELQQFQTIITLGFVLIALLTIRKHFRIKRRIELLKNLLTGIITKKWSLKFWMR